MADKTIEQLNPVARIKPTDLFVCQQDGSAKKVSGQDLENWLLEFAGGHGGIHTLAKTSTSGLVDTYTVTFADTTTSTFTVTNGKSLSNITQYFAVSSSPSSVPGTWSTSRQSLTTTNKYLWSYFRFTYNDNTYMDTTKSVIGVYGDTGLQTHVWIRWSSVPNPRDSDIGQYPDEYIGIYAGTASTAPTTASSYIWYHYKGSKGDKGDNAIISSSSIRYQASADSTIVPGGAWSSTIPSVPQGQYLWTQTTINFNTGNPIVFYSVARFGKDGTGSVVTVNGVSPDENGNVQLEFGSVSTVNGISPDAGKNIQITANDIQTDDNTSVQTRITNLEDSPVTTAKIEDNAVTGEKIASGAVSQVYTATIGTSWVGATAPYYQTIGVMRILPTDTPIIDIVPSTVYTTAEAQLESYEKIYRITTNTNSVTIYATEKTDTDIPIQIRCIRK